MRINHDGVRTCVLNVIPSCACIYYSHQNQYYDIYCKLNRIFYSFFMQIIVLFLKMNC